MRASGASSTKRRQNQPLMCLCRSCFLLPLRAHVHDERMIHNITVCPFDSRRAIPTRRSPGVNESRRTRFLIRFLPGGQSRMQTALRQEKERLDRLCGRQGKPYGVSLPVSSRCSTTKDIPCPGGKDKSPVISQKQKSDKNTLKTSMQREKYHTQFPAWGAG